MIAGAPASFFPAAFSPNSCPAPSTGAGVLEDAPHDEDQSTAGADAAALSSVAQLPSPKSFPTKNPCTLC